MNDLLYLVHRIPYPPTKGDKIRSYNLLLSLARHYRIFLGTMVDDPVDQKHVPTIRAICEDSYFARISPKAAAVRSVQGFLTNNPLSLPYFRDRGLRKWVCSCLRTNAVSKILVFSSVMAQYVVHLDPKRYRKIVDFVDVDSEKWREYSRRKAWPMSCIYERESRRLLSYERRIAKAFDASVFVSEQEASLFSRLAPESSNKVYAVNNGVDLEAFSPDVELPNPYPPEERVLVFTGAMDYWANEDAVVWFVEYIFRTILSRVPTARFYIVGARPTKIVRELANCAGVSVTGTVEDIRPYIVHAHAAVAPMRIARGIQNKVLEALALGKPVVATSAAMEGIDGWPDMAAFVADNPDAFIEQTVRLLTEYRTTFNKNDLRRWMTDRYSWGRNLELIRRLLEGETQGKLSF